MVPHPTSGTTTADPCSNCPHRHQGTASVSDLCCRLDSRLVTVGDHQRLLIYDSGFVETAAHGAKEPKPANRHERRVAELRARLGPRSSKHSLRKRGDRSTYGL